MRPARGAFCSAAMLVLAVIAPVSVAVADDAALVCPRPSGSTQIVRHAGEDRIGTAIAVARAAEAARGSEPRDLDAFVVVGALAFPDATVGAVLAAGRDIPLLLTDGEALDARVADLLVELDSDEDGGVVHIIGGPGVVSQQVERDLATLGFDVDRLAGDTRYETADIVAEQIANDVDPADPVVVATGEDWPDAGSGATLAARAGTLRLVDGRADGTSATPWAEDKDVVIIGGPVAVSEAFEGSLRAVATSVRRIAGADRIETAALVASELPDVPVISATTRDWPDPVAAATLAARTGAAVILVDPVRLPAASARIVAGRASSLVGGTAAVPAWLASDLADASQALPGAPVVLSDTPHPCAAMRTTVGQAASASLTTDATDLRFVSVVVTPDTAALASGISSSTVRDQPPELQAFVSVTPSEPVTHLIEVVLDATGADGQTRTIRRGWTLDVAPEHSTSAEGWLVAGGASGPVGTGGPLASYTVEIADGLESRQDLRGFADAVDATLSDPARGWTSRGDRRLQRVADPGAASIRVLLATPATVDRLCARRGLNTAGIYSCWTGSVAAINSDRWFSGVSHVPDLALYRRYVINHEVGHGLGRSHQSCPGQGQVAPVMMQLTKSTYGCQPNGVPYP